MIFEISTAGWKEFFASGLERCGVGLFFSLGYGNMRRRYRKYEHDENRF